MEVHFYNDVVISLYKLFLILKFLDLILSLVGISFSCTATSKWKKYNFSNFKCLPPQRHQR